MSAANSHTAKEKIERHVLRLCIKNAALWRKQWGELPAWGDPKCPTPKAKWMLVKLSMKLLDMKEPK